MVCLWHNLNIGGLERPFGFLGRAHVGLRDKASSNEILDEVMIWSTTLPRSSTDVLGDVLHTKPKGLLPLRLAMLGSLRLENSITIPAS